MDELQQPKMLLNNYLVLLIYFLRFLLLNTVLTKRLKPDLPLPVMVYSYCFRNRNNEDRMGTMAHLPSFLLAINQRWN